MKAAAKILGHIDCPACGTSKGMRITHDKNGEPFGFCEAECNQQMRIGGNARRVSKFVARYPWAAAPATRAAPVTDTGTKTAPAAAPKPVTGTGTAPKRSSLADAFAFLGGTA